MKKFQKKQAEELIVTLSEAQNEIKIYLQKKQNEVAMNLLSQTQDAAYSLYDFIVGLEGEESLVLADVIMYCDLIFQIHTEIASGEDFNVNNIFKRLNKSLVVLGNSVKNNIEDRIEIVFFPYKASMWDTFESVWLAATDDKRCDVYVVPISYYERNSDRSFGKCHYEGNKYPANVEITHFSEYIHEERKPDVIYIHNPYDDGNFVTSVDPRYYSNKLKKYTDNLVYIPYYSTSGVMGITNRISRAYFNVDYIITQSNTINSFFDIRVPREKLIPLGSPKFDRSINITKEKVNICDEWKEKIENKKIYFYNTSIGGMLADTTEFLNKIIYVFEIFKGRNDVCLLWRPHPLLETAFTSMRPELYETYLTLKNYFVQNGIGIYDDTPDMEKSMAICDAYIGDAGTSVTSLFGIAGKPMFILNNRLCRLPQENDWKSETVKSLFYINSNKYQIINNRKLFVSEENNFEYKFVMTLTDKVKEKNSLFNRALESNEKVFICPNIGNVILVYDGSEHIDTIEIKKYNECINSFYFSILIDDYIFIIPYEYPAIVRINTKTHEVNYIEGYNEVFLSETYGGGINSWNDYLIISSPADDRIMFIHSITLKVQILKTGAKQSEGYKSLIPNGNDIWCLPFKGFNIVKWNVITGECVEYNNLPEGFTLSKNTDQTPFINAVFYDDNVILAPFNGNMFVCINANTGEMKEWEIGINLEKTKENCYLDYFLNAMFLGKVADDVYEVYNTNDRKIYHVNVRTKELVEIDIKFNKSEIIENEIGFGYIGSALIYACVENAFNTLKDFLDDNITGNIFSKEKQLVAFKEISANSDGTCGLNIHRFVMDKIK